MIVYSLSVAAEDVAQQPTNAELQLTVSRLRAALREAQDDADRAWLCVGYTYAARSVVAG